MSKILDQYQVEFSMPVNLGGLKHISSINESMSQFIEDHYTIREANRLLSGINKTIAGIEPGEGGFYTQSLMIAIISASETKIYDNMDEYDDDESMLPSFELPTLDFKEIVEAWANYLITPL